MTSSSGGTLAIAAPITNDGGQGLVVTGYGPLLLLASNTYTGPTVIQSGAILVPTDVISGVPGPLGNASSAILVSNTASYLMASLLISNSGVNFARPIQVQSGPSGVGTVGGEFASGNSTFTGNIGISGSADLMVRAGPVTFNGSISGSGNVAIGGVSGGVVVLNGANTYQGMTNLSYGTLVLGSDFVPGVSGPIGPGLLWLGYGKIAPGGGDRTIPNPISFNGGTIFGDVGGPSLLFTGSATTNVGNVTVNNTTTFADVISGTGSLFLGEAGRAFWRRQRRRRGQYLYRRDFRKFGNHDSQQDGGDARDIEFAHGQRRHGCFPATGHARRHRSIKGDLRRDGVQRQYPQPAQPVLYRGHDCRRHGDDHAFGQHYAADGSFHAAVQLRSGLDRGIAGGLARGHHMRDDNERPINLGSVTRWITTNGGGTAQLNGVVSGGGGIALSLGARVVLANSGNSYAGPTQTTAGSVLYLGASQAIPGVSNLIDNGTFNLAGYGENAWPSAARAMSP